MRSKGAIFITFSLVTLITVVSLFSLSTLSLSADTNTSLVQENSTPPTNETFAKYLILVSEPCEQNTTNLTIKASNPANVTLLFPDNTTLEVWVNKTGVYEVPCINNSCIKARWEGLENETCFSQKCNLEIYVGIPEQKTFSISQPIEWFMEINVKNLGTDSENCTFSVGLPSDAFNVSSEFYSNGSFTLPFIKENSTLTLNVTYLTPEVKLEKETTEKENLIEERVHLFTEANETYELTLNFTIPENYTFLNITPYLHHTVFDKTVSVRVENLEKSLNFTLLFEKIPEKQEPSYKILMGEWKQLDFGVNQPIRKKRLVVIRNLEDREANLSIPLTQPEESLVCSFESDLKLYNSSLVLSLGPEESFSFTEVCSFPEVTLKERDEGKVYVLELESEYSGTYRNITFSIPATFSFASEVPYEKVNGTYVFTLPEFVREEKIILQKEFTSKLLGNSLFESTQGELRAFSIDDTHLNFVIKNLTRGANVSTRITLPFPVSANYYVWANVSGELKLLSLTRDNVLYLTLRDGADADGEANGEIVNSLVLPVKELKNIRVESYVTEDEARFLLNENLVKFKFENGELLSANLTVVPESLIGRKLPYQMFKFKVKGNEAKFRVTFPKPLDFTSKYVKFNPETLEVKEMPFRVLDSHTIEITIQDNSEWDEDPTPGIIADDSGLVESWWNASWKYRKPINVTSSSTENITGFPVHLIVDTSNLIFSGKMNSDCSDIRFTFWNITSQQEEKIPYLFVGPCNTTRSLIWIRLPILYDSNFNTTVLIYYGNSNASNESDASSVFPGIRAYWPFEEGSGSEVNDYSGNNYDGVLADVAGGDIPLWNNSSSCKIGYCIESDDTGDAVNVSYLALNGLNNVTFEAWIKTTDNMWGLISGASSSSDNEYLIYLETTPELRLYTKGSYDGANPGSITDGNWHHLAIVRDSDGTGEIYIDGSLLTALSGLTTGTLSISPNGLWLMQEQDSVGGSWDTGQAYIGALDDVKIFSKSLTLDEIKKETIGYTTSLGSEEYVAQLNTTITYPNEGFIATRYQHFNLNATIYCNRGNCSDVYAYAQYIAPGGISSKITEDTYSDFSTYNETQNVTITDEKIKLQPESGESWFNESWQYRKKINITYNGVENLTDYVIKMTIDTSSLITSGKMNSNCSDIIFTYYNDTSKNEEEIPHWIESDCNSTNTKIWIKVPFIRNSTYGNETIYIYYGNPSANILYKPEDVFEYFVNFTKLGVQSAYGSGQDQTPSQYEVVNDTILHMWGNNWKGVYYGPIQIDGDGKNVLELEINGTNTVEIYGVGVDTDLDNVADAESTTYHFAGSQSWGITPDQTYTNFGNWQTVYAVLDDFSGQYLYFIFANDDDNDANGDVWYKNVRIRRHATPEPTVSIENEEQLNIKSNGYYISNVIDFGRDDIQLNKVYWFDETNENTTIKVYTRSSSDENTWSPWYSETNNSDVDAPDNRYLQYKVELSTTNTQQTPYFDGIVIEYTYTEPQFTNMKSSGTDFTTSANPQTYNDLDESNSPWNASWQITPKEKGNYTLRIWVNSSDTEINPTQSQWINISVYEQTYITEMNIEPNIQARGQDVTISARLLDALSNPITGAVINFTDETSGLVIGNDTTDSNGYATIVYHIPSTASLGYHTIKAEYKQNNTLFYFGSWDTKQLKVSSTPVIWQINTIPTYLGTKEKELIQANVTDEVSLDKVLLYLTYPNGTQIEKEMNYNASSGYYEYTTEELWQAGDYNFYVWANNTDGMSNQSETKTFAVKIIGRLDIAAEKQKYKNFELMHLGNVAHNWPYPNYTYRAAYYVYANESLKDVPIKLQVNTSKLISAGKMNSNCSDILFAEEMHVEELPLQINNPYGTVKYNITFPITITDKETLAELTGDGRDIRIFTYETDQPYAQHSDVPLWVQSVSTSEAKVWVRLSTLPIDGTTLYMYYGNTSAESESNYTEVFKNVVGEAGIVYANNTWVGFKYLNASSDTRYVFASLDTYYGSQEAFARVYNVNQTGFHVYIQESSNLDQSHSFENIGWLALKNGSWIVYGNLWQVGTITDTNAYTHVSFYQSYSSTPVIISQIQTLNEADPAKTRMDNPTSSGVDIKIEETDDTDHAVETIAWFAAPQGFYKVEAQVDLNNFYQNQPSDVSSTSGWNHYNFYTSFSQTPALIAKITTENGGDNSHERMKSVTTTGFDYAIEEENSYDGPHTYEWNSYIAVEPSKPIYGAKYLGTWPETTAMTNKRKVITTIYTQLPHWIESECNSENTSIWVGVSYLNPGKNKLYMYYGNPDDTTVENAADDEINVFTYSSQYGAYVVLGIEGANLDVASYADNNKVTLGSTTMTLAKQQIYTFSSSDVSLGALAYSTAPISSGTQSGGDGAPLTPLAFKGKQFVFAVSRYDPIHFDIYALEDVQVQIWDSGSGSGWHLNDSFTLSDGSSTTKSPPGSPNTDATPEYAYMINSTGDILVFVHQGNEDYLPLVPADTELYLEPSNYLELAAVEDGTSVTIYYSNGNSASVNLDAGDAWASSSLGSDGSAPAARIVSNKPVFAYQLADSDGTEATPALPKSLLDRVFVFPQDAEYFVAVVPAGVSATCTLYKSDGTIRAGPWSVSANSPYPGKIGYGTGQDGTTYIYKGDKLVCNASVYVYYEQASNDAETLVYGPKMHAKEVEVNTSYAYEEDQWVNLENNGNTTLHGYLWAIIQKWDGSQWQNVPPAVINDRATGTLRVIEPGEDLNLTQLWEDYGAWNTSDEPAGKYRVYFALTDDSGNVLYDYEDRYLADWATFEIVPANVTLVNLTYLNLYLHNLKEYETDDKINWINLTIKAYNNSAINTNVHLTLTKTDGSYVGFGPKDEIYACGLVAEGNYCTATYTNTSNGYPIPAGVSFTDEVAVFRVNVTLDNGDDYLNTSYNVTIHNLPNTFNSTIPARLYQNGPPSYYNFTMKNLWSKNLTGVKIKINCPVVVGLTCECVNNPGSAVCDVGNLTQGEVKTASFKITATEDTPVGNYIVNATVNYTNPTGVFHTWPEQQPQALEVRTPGIMTINATSYPQKVTRGGTAEFKAYANNTGEQTASEAWLAYTAYPDGWSISQGQQNVTANNVAPGEYFWNNITFSVAQSAALGEQMVELKSGSNLGQHDFKDLTIEVYANTSIQLWMNDSKVSRDECVRIYAKLLMDNSTTVSGQTIKFYDETDNTYIGESVTDSNGIATIDYAITDSTSLGTHTLNASYAGNSSVYLNPSHNETSMDVGLKPVINSIKILPSPVGYGVNATIRINVTDDNGITYVEVKVTSPSGAVTEANATHVSGNIYEYNYTNTWINGSYSVLVTAYDTYGSKSDDTSEFTVSIDALTIVKTEKKVYYPVEDVKLAAAPAWPMGYKMQISVNNPLSKQLTEYQVELHINTSNLISEGKMQDDCSDMRFIWLNKTSGKEQKIPYYLDYGCNSEDTVVWIKVPVIYANANTTIYMYYGNSEAESESNETAIFSYNKNETTFYVVSYTDSQSALDVIAFADNTHVSFNSNTASLNKGGTYEFSASNDMTTGVAHDKPIYGAFKNDATDALHPISWAGKKFVYRVDRGTNEWYFYAPFGDAQINISNSTHLKTTINLANGSAYRAQVDIEDGDTVLIESNVSILAEHAAGSEDSRLLYPASTKLYGVPSNNLEIAALEDGTHVDVYCSNGNTYSIDLNRGGQWYKSAFGSEGTAPACVVIANKPVGANSLADSDGTETTTFLPLKELDRVYYLPQGAQYIAIAAPFQTICKLYDPDGSLVNQQSASPNGNAPGKIYFGSTTDGTNIQAGSYIICDQPVFAYYEYASYDDETNLYGMKGNRKYYPVELNYTFSEEELSGSAVINFANEFKGYITVEIQKNVSGVWEHKTTLVNDTATNTERDFTGIFDLASLTPSWNPSGETGEYRIKAYVTTQDNHLLNSTHDMLAIYYFNVTQVPLKLNVSDIRVYEAPNNEHGGGTLVAEGTNTTFNLATGKTYRFEIDVDVLSDSSPWQINESNITFNNLNTSWQIDTANSVWYLNETDSVERSGGVFDSGVLKWNTSENDGTGANGTKVTFYFIINLTNGVPEDRSVLFEVRAPQTIFKDYDTLNLYIPDTTPPKLYQGIYGLNTSKVLRGETVKAYARWNEKIGEAKIEYNSTTVDLFNYSIGLPSPNPQNWTNYTISTTSVWNLGRHMVKIYASDIADNWNGTLPYLDLWVKGLSYIDALSVNNTTPTLNDYIKVTCLVKDDTNNKGISGYEVMFWYDGVNFANVTTNSTGYASVVKQVADPGEHIVKCNITNSSLYEIDSRNYKEETIFVSETEAPKWHEIVYPAKAHKGDYVSLNVHWTDNFELDKALLAVNSSGSFVNVSSLQLNGADDWANFSYQIPVDMQPGYLAWRQYANDTSDNENVTEEKTIEVWGWSKVAEVYVQPASITQGNSTVMYCKVVDANYTIEAIAGYTVYFYLGSQYLGSNTTNNSGWAIYNFTPANSGVYTVKCNISDYSAAKYNASEANEGTDTLTVVTGADVTPPKIIDDEYGLNDSSVYRGDAVLVYGHWDEDLNTSWVEFNKTSSFITQTIPSPYSANWTNYTIVTGNDWTPGVHAVKLYANDTSGNLNDTLPYKTFEMWGRSGVYWQSPTGNLPRGVMTIICKVKDYDTGEGITDYTVQFYNSTDYLGSNSTNSTGYAQLTIDTGHYDVGDQTFYCKIVDDNNKYYKAVITQASQTLTLVGKLNTTIVAPLNGSVLNRGETYWLNSTTVDENNKPVSVYASWYANDTLIDNGENISWSVSASQPLGPTLLKVNTSKDYYEPSEDIVTVYIYGHSSVYLIEPVDGSYPQGKQIMVVCKVNDSDTGNAIASYTVKFYYNETLFATQNTNSTGYAQAVLDTSGLEGTYVISCNMSDNSQLYYNTSKASDSTQIEVYVDTTPPIVTIVSPLNKSYNVNSVELNYTVSDDHEVDSCWYSLDNGQNITLPNCQNTTLTSLSDGIHTIRVYANDSAGNENISSITFTVDTHAPIITIISPENKTYGRSWVWTNVSLNEAGDWCGYSLDGSANVSMTKLNSTYWYANVSSLSDGSHKIDFYCNDTAGNSNTTNIFFTVDTNPPLVQLLEPADEAVENSDYLTFVCNASDSVGLTNVSLLTNESGTFEIVHTNTSGINGNYTFDRSVKDGIYRWTCEACDALRCVLASENRTITADTQAPVVNIVLPENTSYIISDVPLNYTISDISLDSCWYSLDNGANTTLPNCQNTTLTSLSDGTHTVRVYANDSLNRVSYDQMTFTVDTTPPQVEIQSPINNTEYGVNYVDLNYIVTDNIAIDSCWYSLDNGANTTLPNCQNTTLTGLDNGVHNVTVYTKDKAGNENYAWVNFSINSVSPVVNIIIPEEQEYYAESDVPLNYTAEDSDLDSCWYSLDNGQNITLPNCQNTTLTSLSDGSHTVRVYANDSQAHESYDEKTFYVDTHAPIITIISPENKTYNISNVQLDYTVEDMYPDSCWYSLDNGVNITLPNCQNTTLTSLTDGTHTVRVYANDSAGNENISSITFTVDTHAPIITIISPENKTYTTSSIDVNYTITDNIAIDSCWYTLDQGESINTNCQNFTLRNLVDGTHTITIYTNDTAGNINSSSVTFTVDTTGPVITFVSPTPDNNQALDYNWTYVNVTMDEDASIALLEWNYNNGTVVNYTMNSNTARNWYFNVSDLPDGEYYYKVYANDSFDNWGVSEQRKIVISVKAPAITIISPQNETYSSNYLPLNVTSSSMIVEWNYSINGGKNITFAENTSLAAAIDTNILYVYGKDNLGRVGVSSVVFTVNATSWKDLFDHYSGIDEQNNLTVENSKAKIKFCWDTLPECWKYRLPIKLQSSADYTDVQVNLSVDTESFISSDKMRSDCGDIRFTYYNETDGTEQTVPYWVESGCNSTNTVIWIKVPELKTGQNVTVYMYYGNPDASSESNETTVMQFHTQSASCEIQSVSELCNVTFNASSGYVFINGTLDLLMAGDLGYGGAYANEGTCDIGEIYERVNTTIAGICKGVYSTGVDDCTLRRPSLWPKWVKNEIEGKTAFSAMVQGNEKVNADPDSCGFVAKYVYILNWTERKDIQMPTVYKLSEEVQAKNASVTSIEIKPLKIAKWLNFTSVATEPFGTSVTFEILNSSGYVLKTCSLSEATNGCNLNNLNTKSIKLKALLNTSEGGVTPEIDEWNVSWTTKYTPLIKGTNETAQVDPNILIKVWKGASLLYQAYGQATPELEMNELYNLTGEKDCNGKVYVKLYNYNASTEQTILEQIICNYQGYKPSQISNTTPVYALNDTELSYEKATIYLPKNGLHIDYIMHCTDWSFSTANCSSWQLLEPSSLEGYGENSTHIWFNVSSFEAYTAGQLGYDLQVNQIYFNESSPKENDAIKVIVNVSNNGGSDINDAKIMLKYTLWNDSAWIDEEIQNKTVYVAAGSYNLTNFTWIAKPGTWNFTVVADPDNEISESNEDNNDNSTNYTVPAWNVFYGKVNSWLTLADAQGKNFTVWIPKIPEGTLYFADVDSEFNFSDLRPLNGTNDLSEADEALNMTGFNDSIKKLFDKNNDNLPDATGCFIVNDKELCDVPIINSTEGNGGNFTTGILWDSGDGGSEYSGTQDLIFVTRINGTKVGSYGTYDYEVRVPAYLRQQNAPNNAISIYMEIV